LAVDRSFNPRLVQVVADRIRDTHTHNTALDELTSAFRNPEILWRKSFSPLTPEAQETLLTLATLPPRPIELGTLRELARFAGSTIKWHNAVHTLEPAWIALADSTTEKTIYFSNPSCRNYLLNTLDDPDHAADCYDRIVRMDQLLNLAQESGIVAPYQVGDARPDRPRLARALHGHRTQLASKIEKWSEDSLDQDLSHVVTLRTLADAAMLLTAFGSPDSNMWLLIRVRDQILTDVLTPPTHLALTLACRLAEVEFSDECVRAQAVEQLILGALRASENTRDLVPYEELPDWLITESTRALARQQAKPMFDAELETLMTAGYAASDALADAEELRERAVRYGFTLDLEDFLDHLRPDSR